MNARAASGRDRRGRGMRGPRSLPGPWTPHGLPAHRSGRAWFDDVVADAYEQICAHSEHSQQLTQLVIEEAPVLPDTWDEPVFSSALQVTGEGHPRVVVYRLPIIARASSTAEIVEAVWAVLLHRLSEAWHVPPETLDPRA